MWNRAQKFNDIKVGDFLESYKNVEVKRVSSTINKYFHDCQNYFC